MKKTTFFIFIATLFVSLFPLPNFSARADNFEYGRVINEVTPFFKDAEKKETLFFLPYTYYVKVLGEENDLIKIEYGGDNLPAISGYTEKGALFFDGLSVKNPYPVVKIKTRADAPFFADSSFLSVSQYVFAERELVYYGSLPDGKGGYSLFAAFNQRLGYVKEEDVYPFAVGNHPNELTFIPKTENTEKIKADDVSDKKDFDGIKLAVVLSLVFAGVVALFIALFPKKKRTPPPDPADDGERE